MSGIPTDDPWVQFCWEYPGPQPTSTRKWWDEAIGAGYPPTAIVAQARVYRRLCDNQDQLPAPADMWLAAFVEFSPDDETGPSEAESFSAAVRALRAVKGWSQKELASRAEIDTRTLAQIENESATYSARRSTRLAVADALGWSVDEMVDLGCMVLAR